MKLIEGLLMQDNISNKCSDKNTKDMKNIYKEEQKINLLCFSRPKRLVC